MTEDQIIGLLSSNIIYLLAAALIVIVILKGIKIVPQSIGISRKFGFR